MPVGEFSHECRSSRDWYLPHHPVVNTNKPEKLRRVLNGASKILGKSLNSCLLTGPDLLQDFQTSSIASGSISMQFQQKLKECSFRSMCLLQIHHACVFLWREDPTQKTETLQYTRLILERETRRRALTLPFNKQLETMEPSILLPQKTFNRSFIWMTTSFLLSVLKLL